MLLSTIPASDTLSSGPSQLDKKGSTAPAATKPRPSIQPNPVQVLKKISREVTTNEIQVLTEDGTVISKAELRLKAQVKYLSASLQGELSLISTLMMLRCFWIAFNHM